MSDSQQQPISVEPYKSKRVEFHFTPKTAFWANIFEDYFKVKRVKKPQKNT